MEKMKAISPKSMLQAAAPRPRMERAEGTTVRDHPKHPIELTAHSGKRKIGNMGSKKGC